MPSQSPSNLQSEDSMKIALELSDMQLIAMNTPEEREVSYKLKEVRDAMWGDSRKNLKPMSDAKKKDVLENTIKKLQDPKQKALFLESYAKMGYLYEIGSITARENYLENMRNDPDKTPPGGVQEFVKNNQDKSVSELAEHLSTPVFEVVMTAHPTNVNSLDSIKLQREIAKAIKKGDEKEIMDAVEKYQHTQILHQVDGKDTNLSVRDETKNILYFMGNIYEDLPKVYEHYDDVLNKQAEKNGEKYNKLDLNLQTRLASWGSSGDKDGNAKITAETTLEAIALHTKEALTRYSEDLAKIPEMNGWKEKFDEKLKALDEKNPDSLLGRISKLCDTAKAKTDTPENLSKRFDALSDELTELRKDLDSKKFAEDLTEVTKKDDQVGQDALSLLRRFKVFGFVFGTIEYRETAEEYTRVVGEILKERIPNYEKLPPEEKAKQLTEILGEENNTASTLLKQKIEGIVQNGAAREYDKNDPLPITYHTIKRMELARDFPDILQNNVLAECGKIELKGENGEHKEPTKEQASAQGVANFLEAQFLQRSVEKDGKRALMGIVPLFEERDTMMYVSDIMEAAYKNPEHKKQMEEVSKRDGKPLTQQVQIAHSDNSRRSGVQAARGYIHDAHKKLRALGDRADIKVHTEFYEGGSISDAYRNGVRAISANVNSFQTHDFAKFTFQGGDLLNYFNNPYSTERIFDRSIGHQAGHLFKNGSYHVDKLDDDKRVPNDVVDDVAIAAMKLTYSDYEKKDFVKENMAKLMTLLDYEGWNAVANAGSRAPSRGGSTEEKKDKIAFGKVKEIGIGAIDSVGIDKIRTIGYSMTQQVGALLPTMIGADKLETYLNDEVKNKCEQIEVKSESDRTADEKEFLQKLKIEEGNKLSPKQIKFIYEKSPTFRDGQDKASAGIAISDLDATEKLLKKHVKNYLLNKTDISEAEKPQAEQIANDAVDNFDYWDRVKKTYKDAASLTYQAVTGNPMNNNNYDNAQISSMMKKALPNMKDDFTNKLGYRDFLLSIRAANDNMFDKGKQNEDPANFHYDRLWAAAIQAVTHGRWLGASDPTVYRSQAQENGQGRG